MENKQLGEYKTKDLGEATAIITKGVTLNRIERNGQICFFVFENEKKCEELSNKFFFGNLQVNAREYHEGMARLKNRIFK